MTDLSEQIRQQLRDSSASGARIARESGVSVRAVSDFLAGRQVNSGTLDRLWEWVGRSSEADADTDESVRGE